MSEPEMSETKLGPNCGTCTYCRERRDTDRVTESGHRHDQLWCVLHNMPTEKQYLRCGGGDWEPIRTT